MKCRCSWRWIVYILCAVGFFLGGNRFSDAQAVYGSLYGTVADPSGAVVPNGKVTVIDEQKGTTQVTQTNASGDWRVDHLIPDTYDVRIEISGFAPAEAKGVAVHADTAQQVNLALQPSGAQQSVTVTDAAPALKTDRADVATILDERAVQNLPNLTRNFTQFELLTPGVQRSSFNILGPEDPQGSVAVNSNGSNYGVQGWLLDGTDNRDPVLGIIVINPTLDSIGEMKVTTQNYDAEFGGAAGGIISAQTKSGGNDFHGDAFEFRHSDAQLARDPFAQTAVNPVTHRFIPSQLYNQFGGSVGGPIIKDKAFFFLDYQGTRQRLGSSFLESVPTAAVRSSCLGSGSVTCDLSQYISRFSANNGQTPTLYNPATRAQYPNGQIPVSTLSPQAIRLLSALPPPSPGLTGITNNFAASGNGVSNADQADIRLDHQVTGSIHAFGRYDYAIFRLSGAPSFGAAGGAGFGVTNTTGNDEVQNQSAAVGFDWALHPNLLTDFRFGFLSYHVSENKFTAGTEPALAAGIPNLNTGQFDTSGSPTFNFTDNSIGANGQGFGNQGCNCPLLESEQVFQIANNWTKVIGNHSIKFGGDIRYALNLRNASDNNRTGVLLFGNGSTAGPNGAGLGLASFLLGYVDEFQRFDVYVQNAANRQKRGAFYAQDSWRATNKLTVNYGVRWDVIYPETVNSPGNGGFADIATGVIRVAGVGGIGTNGNQKMNYLNLAGRLGVAYQVTPHTVVRGAVGQVYDDVGYFGTIFGSVITHNLPVLANEDINSGNGTGAFSTTLGNPPVRPPQPFIPSNGLIPLQNGISPQFRPPRIQLPKVDQWNLTLQRQLGPNTTFEIAYVGNHAEHIYPGETYGYDLNAPVLPRSPADLTASDTNTTPGVRSRNQRRPYYQRFNSVYNGAPTQCCNQALTSAYPSANANYHALQTDIQKRFANGLQFNANYTWSKALNYANDEAFANYPRISYGPNDTNRAQVFVLSGLYQLPFGRNRLFLSHSGRLIDYLVGGYTLSGDTTWESGLPFTPTYAECGSDEDIDNNFSGPGTTTDCRPNGTNAHLPLSAGGYNPVTHTVQYFTPVAPLTANGAVSGPFQRPAFGTFGNIGRNSFRGPSEYLADVTLMKDIPIRERVRGQFQFQAFNIFNHPALGLPTSSGARSIDSSTGGVITSLDPNIAMRQLQFAARITF